MYVRYELDREERVAAICKKFDSYTGVQLSTACGWKGSVIWHSGSLLSMLRIGAYLFVPNVAQFDMFVIDDITLQRLHEATRNAYQSKSIVKDWLSYGPRTQVIIGR